MIAPSVPRISSQEQIRTALNHEGLLHRSCSLLTDVSSTAIIANSAYWLSHGSKPKSCHNRRPDQDRKGKSVIDAP